MAGRFTRRIGGFGNWMRQYLKILLGAGTACLIVIALAFSTSGRAQETEDVNQVIRVLSHETASSTDNYLMPAVIASNVVAEWLANPLNTERSADATELTDLLLTTVSENDSFDGIFVGYPNGEFSYVHRSDETNDGGYRVKTIRLESTGADGARELALVSRINWLASDRSLTGAEILPDDTYDPRDRSWYQGALNAPAGGWTEPYAFFTSGLPGVTRFRALQDRTGEIVAVVGTDVRIAQLSAFVMDRSPSANGLTFILGENDSVIAHPDLDQLVSGDAGLRQVSEFSDPRVAAARSIDALPQPATNTGAIDPMFESRITNVSLTDKPFTFAVTPLSTAPGWNLVVTTPESDFLDATRVSRDNLGRIALAMAAALAFALIVMTRATMRQLRADAFSDSLTGLANRKRAMQMMDTLRDNNEGFIAAIVDIDAFKPVNDTHGHAAGDEVLKRIARQLDRAASDEGLACRLGGDEFLIILPGFEAGAALSLSRSIVADAGRPQEAETVGTVTVSIGLAAFIPNAVRPSVVSTLRNADIALYLAKRSGGNQAILFDEKLHSTSDSEDARRHELARAIMTDDLTIRFEPEIDLATGMVCGVVPSAQWIQADGTTVAPEQLLPEVAALNMVPDLTASLMTSARTLADHWKLTNPSTRLRIHFPLTLDRLLQSDFEGDLDRSGLLSVATPVFELFAETLLGLSDRNQQRLARLRDSGVLVAVTRFGLDEIPLTRFQALNADIIKVDPGVLTGLATDTTASALARFMVTLGKSLQVEVMASSVATEEQSRALAAIGYHTATGPHYGIDLEMGEFLTSPTTSR